jgi:hypothetical protein
MSIDGSVPFGPPPTSSSCVGCRVPADRRAAARSEASKKAAAGWHLIGGLPRGGMAPPGATSHMALVAVEVAVVVAVEVEVAMVVEVEVAVVVVW